MVFSVSFIAEAEGIAVDQLMCFTDSLHRSGIKLYPVDRSCIVAAIVEVESSVIVNEQSGVPEIKGSRDLLIRPVQNIPGAVEIADDASSGGTEVNIVTDNRNIRSVIIKRKLLGKRVRVPVNKVIGDPDGKRHGSKNIIFSLKKNHRRISRFA